MGLLTSSIGDRMDGVGGFDRRIWALSTVVIAGALMTILSTTSVNVALTALSRDLDVSLDHIQWIVTGYLLGLATVIPLTGWASERFGVRRLWMVTVGLFMAASVLCGLAWSADALITFRVVQALAGGMIMPTGMIALTLAVGPGRVGRAVSLIGVPMLLAPAFGPVLGGLFVEHASWRWIFYVNVPFGLASLVLAWRLLPVDGPRGRHRLDWVGLLLASPGLALLTFGMAEIPMRGGVGHSSVYLPIGGGVALLAAFVAHARRITHPLLDIRLFARLRVAAAFATTLLLGAALFGSLLILPLYFQVLRGEDALTTGLLLVPQGVGAAAIMPFTGPLTDRLGGGPVVMAGLIMLALATVALALAGADTSYPLLMATLLVRGFGLGASFMPAMAAGYAAIEPGAVPRATSAMNVMQRVGGSIGAALLAVILQQQIARNGPVADAFSHTFWWAFALTVIAMPPALVLCFGERLARVAMVPGGRDPRGKDH